MSSVGQPMRTQDEAAAPVPRSSELLLAIAGEQQDDRIAIGEIVDGLGDRAYGLVFVLLALPNIIPAPPGLGGAFGLIMTSSQGSCCLARPSLSCRASSGVGAFCAHASGACSRARSRFLRGLSDTAGRVGRR